jgi:hypothetical protein
MSKFVIGSILGALTLMCQEPQDFAIRADRDYPRLDRVRPDLPADGLIPQGVAAITDISRPSMRSMQPAQGLESPSEVPTATPLLARALGNYPIPRTSILRLVKTTLLQARIRNGMSIEQVRRLLGDEESTESSGFGDETAIIRTYQRGTIVVRFDMHGKVIGW